MKKVDLVTNMNLDTVHYLAVLLFPVPLLSKGLDTADLARTGSQKCCPCLDAGFA